MDLETSSLFAVDCDKSQVPPIHQKRILAFVNQFILNTCTFLNKFATQCETKFVEVERKLQKVEACLTIIEEKLASIPGLDVKNEEIQIIEENVDKEKTKNSEDTKVENPVPEAEELIYEPEGVKAIEDVRYKKYFKMLQFGVPANAIKMKMATEGLNQDILDTPNLILPDGTIEAPEN